MSAVEYLYWISIVVNFWEVRAGIFVGLFLSAFALAFGYAGALAKDEAFDGQRLVTIAWRSLAALSVLFLVSSFVPRPCDLIVTAMAEHVDQPEVLRLLESQYSVKGCKN